MAEVVFLILNYKTYTDTIRITEELLGFCRDDFRVVIVDNASPNESFQVLADSFGKNPFVDVIASNENGGYAKGNNYGLRYIEKYSPRYVAILNNDIHFDVSTIDRLISDFSKIGDIGVIAPAQCTPDGEVVRFSDLKCHNFWDDIVDNLNFRKRTYHIYRSNTVDENIEKVGIVPGAFIFSDFSILKSADYFDECTFLYCEERFLSKRLAAIGKSCYIDFGCSYIHEHSSTIGTVAGTKKQLEWLGQSRRLFIKKYGRYPKIQLLIFNMSVRFRKIVERLSEIKKSM